MNMLEQRGNFISGLNKNNHKHTIVLNYLCSSLNKHEKSLLISKSFFFVQFKTVLCKHIMIWKNTIFAFKNKFFPYLKYYLFTIFKHVICQNNYLSRNLSILFYNNHFIIFQFLLSRFWYCCPVYSIKYVIYVIIYMYMHKIIYKYLWRYTNYIHIYKSMFHIVTWTHST